jgi:hypothetical protein
MINRQCTRFRTSLYCIAFVVIMVTPAAAEPLSRQEAIDILVREVILPSPTRNLLMAFGPQHPLTPKDLVEPPAEGWDPRQGMVRTIEKPTWFFWIDDEPDAKFAHPTRYVYIEADRSDPKINDGIIVDFQAWWPKINGKHYLSRDFDRFFDCPDKVYGQPPPLDYKPPQK